MPTRWLKLTVAYDGTAYAGWQIQPNVPTVQAALETAWHEITREEVRMMSAGRTDAGVHALGQVTSVATDSQLSTSDLQRGLNAVLPEDVAVVAVDEAPENFHATHDAKRKTYRYQIHNGRTPDVFNRRFVWHYPQPLDAEKMHAAAQALLGKHDFSSFESVGSERPDSVRTLFAASVTREGEAPAEPFTALGKHDFSSFESVGSERPDSVRTLFAASVTREGEAPTEPFTALGKSLSLPDHHRINIEVTGDGFLYNMVRAITGTLIEVGKGAREPAWVAEVLAARDRRLAGQTSPPHGLFLVSVEY